MFDILFIRAGSTMSRTVNSVNTTPIMVRPLEVPAVPSYGVPSLVYATGSGWHPAEPASATPNMGNVLA